MSEQKPFQNSQENWQTLKNDSDGSFFKILSQPVQCFEMRFSGIAPKNTNVEYFESLATMHDHRNFEVSAIHIPFYTFAVGMLIAVSIAWAITGESLLPMYLCYIAMVCTFSFFIDGNGFVFFNGIKNASFVAGGCAGLFAVSMVSWIWMKILGKSWLFNFPIFSRVS